MHPDNEHPEHRNALKAWGRGEWDRARELFRLCIAEAEGANDNSWLTYYLQELAALEGESGSREPQNRCQGE